MRLVQGQTHYAPPKSVSLPPFQARTVRSNDVCECVKEVSNYAA